jgi:hypothetical protein
LAKNHRRIGLPINQSALLEILENPIEHSRFRMKNIFLFNPRNIFHPLFSIRESPRTFPGFVALNLKASEFV